MRWPLLNETGRWGVMGTDLGANTEHDERLYFFFGDVAVEQQADHRFFSGNPNNTDFVAWTDDKTILEHGGHLAQGWNFSLPNDHQGATDTTGQKDWRFCSKCGGLFWAPNNRTAGVCPKGGAHVHHPASWNFFLPNDHQGATDRTGQKDWRFCSKCHGLFWAPNGDPTGSICPQDNARHAAVGLNFYLPNDQQGATAATGQEEWRFCANCHGLFWNDDAFKGLCLGASGGGFHLHAVLKSQGVRPGKFAPFTVKDPIGPLLEFETPTGAFSYDGRVYVFIWVENDRGQSYPKGSYLVSTRNPGDAREFEIEFLFSRFADNPCGLWQVASCVVKNAKHPLLPANSGDGLVMFGYGGNASEQTDAIHLAWMPLYAGHPIRQESIRYYTGVADYWSEDPTRAGPLPFELQPHYTSVSAAWMPEVRRWIVLYSEATNERDFVDYKGPIVARTSANLREWSEPIKLFDPRSYGAYGLGKFMHWPGDDSMDRDIPPLPPPLEPSSTIRENKPGWAYGAFILNRFTDWNDPTRTLTIYYLLSTGRPYQVHLMRTRLQSLLVPIGRITTADQMLDLVVPALIAIIAILVFFRVHPAQKFSFAPAMVLAFVCYLRTRYREMPKTGRILPVYLIALAIQFLHFSEEYIYGFQFRVTEITPGMPPFKVNVFVAFNMVAYCLFLLAGLGMYKGMKFSMIIVWFFAICVLGNSIWHLLLTLKVGGYFPGLYTSLPGWILGPILLRRLWGQRSVSHTS